MEKVIVYLDYYGAVNFFSRLAVSDVEREYKFITTSLLGFLILKKKNFDVQLLTLFSPSSRFSLSDADTKSTLEYKARYASENKIVKLSSILYESLQKIYDSNSKKNHVFLCWNGSSLGGKVLRAFKATHKNISLGFVEISNLPGKLFVDCLGVNKESTLYKTPEYLDQLDDCPDFEDFRRSYMSLKKSYKPKAREKVGFLGLLVEYFYFAFFGVRTFSLSKPFQPFLNSILRWLFNNLYFKKSLPDKYSIYPMQVRSDTQLVLNSSVSVGEALDLALSETESALVITPHPYDYGVMWGLLGKILSKDSKIIITEKSTFQIIDQASVVFVINSTLGLEAMILGKKVVFFGDSFYQFLSGSRLAKYITHFLVGIDFYDDQNLSSFQIDEFYQAILKTENFNSKIKFS